MSSRVPMPQPIKLPTKDEISNLAAGEIANRISKFIAASNEENKQRFKRGFFYRWAYVLGSLAVSLLIVLPSAVYQICAFQKCWFTGGCYFIVFMIFALGVIVNRRMKHDPNWAECIVPGTNDISDRMSAAVASDAAVMECLKNIDPLILRSMRASCDYTIKHTLADDKTIFSFVKVSALAGALSAVSAHVNHMIHSDTPILGFIPQNRMLFLILSDGTLLFCVTLIAVYLNQKSSFDKRKRCMSSLSQMLNETIPAKVVIEPGAVFAVDHVYPGPVNSPNAPVGSVHLPVTTSPSH